MNHPGRDPGRTIPTMHHCPRGPLFCACLWAGETAVALKKKKSTCFLHLWVPEPLNKCETFAKSQGSSQTKVKSFWEVQGNTEQNVKYFYSSLLKTSKYPIQRTSVVILGLLEQITLEFWLRIKILEMYLKIVTDMQKCGSKNHYCNTFYDEGKSEHPKSQTIGKWLGKFWYSDKMKCYIDTKNSVEKN